MFPGCGYLLHGARFDRWRVTTLLGRSSVADLYGAVVMPEVGSSLPLYDKVLIKVLRSPRPDAIPQVERLVQLKHPYIHPIVAGGLVENDNTLYLLVPFEERGNLWPYTRQDRRLPTGMVANLMRQLAEGLQYAHDQGIEHGRIKPENCLVVTPSKVQLSDFYNLLLAREALSFGQIDPTADIAALALLAYQLFSGAHPFSGALPMPGRSMSGVLYRPLREFRADLPPQIDEILQRALMPSGYDRFPRVSVFAQALHQAVEGRKSTSGPMAFPVQTRSSSQELASSFRKQVVGPPQKIIELCQLPGHTSPIRTMAWASDGTHLASACDDPNIRLWRIRQRIGTPLGMLSGHTAKVLALEWSPQGEVLASTSADGTVRLWDALAPVVSARARAAWLGHDGAIPALCWSQDGTYLATGGADRAIRIWQMGGDVLAAWIAHGRGGVTALSWSPDGRFVASGGADQAVYVWDPVSGNRVFSLVEHSDEIRTISWSPDGSFLATVAGKKDQRVCLWSAQNGQLLAQLRGHAREVVGVFWDPRQANWLATIGADRTLRFWSTRNPVPGTPLHALQLPVSVSASAGPTGTYMLALGKEDMQVGIFQLS